MYMKQRKQRGGSETPNITWIEKIHLWFVQYVTPKH
jgi:hypothetical protein